MSRVKALLETRRWWYRMADRVTAPLSDVIFANSQAAEADFLQWIGTDHHDIRVIPNGLDIDTFLSAPTVDVRGLYGIEEETGIILTVGRLSAEKDCATLLRACARLNSTPLNWRLMIVGHGTLEAELQDLSRNLDLEEHVIFCGRVDDPQSYYSAADLFVLTSLLEGLPNALIEAQAYGLAAITTDSGGATEVIQDGVTGLTVPVGDDKRLAEAMIELLGDPGARAEMGREGVKVMRRRFGIDQMVDALDQLTDRESFDRS